MIDSWPSSLSLTLQVAVLFFSLVLALWILRHQLRDFVTIAVILYPCNTVYHVVRKRGTLAIDLNQVIPKMSRCCNRGLLP